jgi:hypothetical protein
MERDLENLGGFHHDQKRSCGRCLCIRCRVWHFERQGGAKRQRQGQRSNNQNAGGAILGDRLSNRES